MIACKHTGLGNINFDSQTFTYKLILTKHVQEKREPESFDENIKSKNRIHKDFTLLRLDYIIRPFLHKMMKKDGKYVISINKNKDSKNVKVIVVAVERGCSASLADYKVIVITALNSARIGDTISFNKIPIENRFVSSAYFDDLIEITELSDGEVKFDYKKAVKVPDRSYIKKPKELIDAIPIVIPGFRIVKKKEY